MTTKASISIHSCANFTQTRLQGVPRASRTTVEAQFTGKHAAYRLCAHIERVQFQNVRDTYSHTHSIKGPPIRAHTQTHTNYIHSQPQTDRRGCEVETTEQLIHIKSACVPECVSVCCYLQRLNVFVYVCVFLCVFLSTCAGVLYACEQETLVSPSCAPFARTSVARASVGRTSKKVCTHAVQQLQLQTGI